MTIIDKIDKIQLPKTDKYFEKSSMDGYAFYGAARINLGLDTELMKHEVSNRCFGLNKTWNRKDGILLPADEPYTYTCFPCYMFYNGLNDNTGLDKVISTLDLIGRYPSGMMRYCNTEINLEVPNVSALAAYMYSHYNISITYDLIRVLHNRQLSSGNWQYTGLNSHTKRVMRCEDTAHLAMMVIGLRGVENITGIKTNDMVKKAQACLCSMNEPKFPIKAIDWGPPFLYVAMLGTGHPIEIRAKNRSIELLEHTNFRVRAIASWALSVNFI